MAPSRIVWTPVPNGYGGGKLRISVLISPRLAGASTLGGYSDWLAWPSVKPTYAVTFQGGPPVPATISSPAPRLDLWKTLFNTGTPVTVQGPLAQAASVPAIRSWPSAAARSMGRARHASALAFTPTAPPTVNDYFPGIIFPPGNGGQASSQANADEPVTDIYVPPDRLQRAITLIDEKLTADGFFLGGPLGGTASSPEFTAAQVNFLLAEQFHHRAANGSSPQLKKRSLAAHVARIQGGDGLDFHSALGSFAQYPALQRALGLIVDLTVDPAAIGVPIPTDPVTMRLTASWTPSGTDSYDPIYPVVTATLTASAFQAKPSGTTTKDGLLALGTDTFDVVEVDADSASAGLTALSRTLNTRRTRFIGGGLAPAASATNAAQEPPPAGGVPISKDPGGEPAPLPALRSTGFSIVQFGRAQQLHQTLLAATARTAAVKPLADDPFHAEDLGYGVRVDVWDDVSRRWHSLCRRKGTYDVNGTPLVVEDEGIVTLAHTERVDDPTIYLHESIFSWSGYSLVTNRPGSTSETVSGKQVTVGPDSEATGPVKLRTSFRATGLAKLRYGRSYRFRARVVDITGNGLGPDDPPAADFGSSTPPTRYLRFEAVGSPLLLPAAPRTAGESAQLMVIRGNYNQPATGDCQRHVVPPRISQLMAEQHGLYDVPASLLNPGGIDTFVYSDIVRRDKGSFDDSGKTDPDGWGDVHYYEDSVLDVPYIPDVLARGAAFRGLPGLAAGEILTADFGDRSSWPRRDGLRIRLVNGTGKPGYNSLSRVLTVQLPPGRTADVAYSCRVDDADIDLSGVWNWFVQSGLQPGDGRSVQDLRNLAAKGQLWQVTPAGTLRLTHAIRQPLTPPAFVKPVVVRQPGDTTARIVDVLNIDRPSTAQVDIEARWSEPVDWRNDPEPTQRSSGTHVVKLIAAADAPDANRLQVTGVHEFHDTKHRQVTYSAMGTSRYVEFFAETSRITLSGTTPVKVSPNGVASGTLTVTDPSTGKDFTRDLTAMGGRAGDYVADLAAGTVARTASGSGIADGALVAVHFVAGSVTRSNVEAQPPVVLNVRSSARPAAADIAYLVPTFGWERTNDSTALSATRRGNGLRVYLRRPWYSSGDGEMLGVVLFEGNGDLPPTLRQYVTLRAQDPIFASSTTTNAPLITEFPLAVRPKTGYRLAESDALPELTATVAAAPHAVGYDKSRQMWYCDITVTPDKAYTPFLRFALARFQPNSLAGVELSPVVLAQFAQLNPDRTLSAVFDPVDTTRVHVTVAGTTYTATPQKTSQVKILVQVADPKPLGALGWKTVFEGELAASSPAGQWSGDIRLPGGRGSQPMRLVVEERERLSVEGTRLVYVDAVEI
jgi:hypothetical protein